MRVAIENADGLQRDINSLAILNANTEERRRAKLLRNRNKMLEKRLQDLEARINTLEERLRIIEHG